MSSSSEVNYPRGGVSTKKTPANNIGEGSAGLGDSGYPKGSNPTTGQFQSLSSQKTAARDYEESQAHPDETKEDTSFMGRKPGQSETLPGWNKVKDMTGL